MLRSKSLVTSCPMSAGGVVGQRQLCFSGHRMILVLPLFCWKFCRKLCLNNPNNAKQGESLAAQSAGPHLGWSLWQTHIWLEKTPLAARGLAVLT